MSYFHSKMANFGHILGESGEFHERRIYDDQNTFNLLNIAAVVLGKAVTLMLVVLIVCSNIHLEFLWIGNVENLWRFAWYVQIFHLEFYVQSIVFLWAFRLDESKTRWDPSIEVLFCLNSTWICRDHNFNQTCTLFCCMTERYFPLFHPKKFAIFFQQLSIITFHTM